MHESEKTIREFYARFGERDAEGMIACYAPDVHFSDPVFTSLRGEEAFAMWRMLCKRGKDLTIEASGFEGDETSGKAHWDARYTFSQTGRPVLNRIDAQFTFRDGKIVRHQDSFDLWAWTAMALGVPGRLFGWLPPFQNALRKKADAGLRDFMRR